MIALTRLATPVTLLFALFCCIGPKATHAQDETLIKVDTVLLNVPVHVSDKTGEPVKGLKKEDFELTIGERKREIDFFTSEGPVTVAILIDANSNTAPVIDRIRRDAQQFVELLGPEDRAMVIRFNLQYKILSDLTSDKGKLRRAISGIDNHSQRVRIMDFVLHQVIYHELAGVKGKKAIVVFGDPDSAISWHDSNLKPGDFFYSNFLQESDIPVYPIFYQTYSLPRELDGKTLTLDQLMQVPPIKNFYYYSTLTGGRFYAAGASDFKSAFPRIIEDIRHQYVLGIHAGDDTDGKVNDLNIRISRQGLTVRTKQKIKPVNAEERKKWVDRYLNANTRQ